jgi:uncharacterized protein YndB with AHSA1/START domain
MLETALYVALGLAGIAAIVVLVASRRPDTQKFVRSIEIAAAPDAIFPLINDLRLFSTWSPFENDPSMKKAYSGPDRGQGQRMDWNGNSQVGEGSVTILGSTPSSRIDMQLSTIRPMSGENHVSFTLAPSAGRTTVTWSIEGAVPLMVKVMRLFIDMDRMCGGMFEKGLASLKAQVESSAVVAKRA